MAHRPASRLLLPDEPPAYAVLRPRGASRMVLLCDHASAKIPMRLGDLGLSDAQRASHIAWDLGILPIASALSDRFDAPLISSGYSRLVIDCNRPLHSETSIPAVTCEIEVPGNRDLTEGDRRARVEELFAPYHAAIVGVLAQREQLGRESIIVSLHSFTPHLFGKDRPWHVGVMYGADDRLAKELLVGFREESSIVVGDNEPYRVTGHSDYGIPVYALGPGRLGALIELRQDLTGDPATQPEAAKMVERLTRVLAPFS